MATRKIYRKCLKKPKRDLWIFTSTVVSLSVALLKECGYQIEGSQQKKQIKYMIGIKNGFPDKINLYHHKTYNSDNRAMEEAILETEIKKNSIILFDGGLRSREVFEKLTEKRLFVSAVSQRDTK